MVLYLFFLFLQFSVSYIEVFFFFIVNFHHHDFRFVSTIARTYEQVLLWAVRVCKGFSGFFVSHVLFFYLAVFYVSRNVSCLLTPCYCLCLKS